MARGWESKAVEAQQADAAAQASVRPFSADEAARRARRTTLTLARRSAEDNLRSATAPAHRSMLEHAIEDLDRRIAELG